MQQVSEQQNIVIETISFDLLMCYQNAVWCFSYSVSDNVNSSI